MVETSMVETSMRETSMRETRNAKFKMMMVFYLGVNVLASFEI